VIAAPCSARTMGGEPAICARAVSQEAAKRSAGGDSPGLPPGLVACQAPPLHEIMKGEARLEEGGGGYRWP
jgi:hypothetical protein